MEEPITILEDGRETHPAFGRVVVNLASHGGYHGGSVLFDSDIRHDRVVHITFYGASRKRDLNHDFIYPDNRPILEVVMSMAQWAAMVSSFGNGGGTSCTLTYRADQGDLPSIPFAPRMALSMSETRNAAVKAFEGIKTAFTRYKERKTADNLRHLEAEIRNAPANVIFTGEQLTRYVEGTVQNARADVEAMVTQRVQQLGLRPK